MVNTYQPSWSGEPGRSTVGAICCVVQAGSQPDALYRTLRERRSATSPGPVELDGGAGHVRPDCDLANSVVPDSKFVVKLALTYLPIPTGRRHADPGGRDAAPACQAVLGESATADTIRATTLPRRTISISSPAAAR